MYCKFCGPVKPAAGEKFQGFSTKSDLCDLVIIVELRDSFEID